MIKFRQSAMMYMRWNVGKIKQQVVNNPASFNADDIENAARAIAGVANSGIHRLFSAETVKGTGWRPTRLKPEYVEQPDIFKQKLASFIQEANELVDVAADGDIDRIKPQFGKMFASCQACHQSFRAK